MYKIKKSIGNSYSNFSDMNEVSYDDDFEDFDFVVDDEIDRSLVTPPVSVTPTFTPESNSSNNNLKSKSSNLVDLEVLNSLESEYNYEDDLTTSDFGNESFDFQSFHEIFDEIPIQKEKRYKNGTRSSLTFSNQRTREIERANHILLNKIMKNGPSGDASERRYNINYNNQRPVIKSAAEINRKKQQQKIQYENHILKRKLDKIASRRPVPN